MRMTMLAFAATAVVCLSAFVSDDTAMLKARIVELEAKLAEHHAERERTKMHLAHFRELDLVAFNKRDMQRLAEIHHEDVDVYQPDGSLTKGHIGHHDKELELLFEVFDWKIPRHIIGFGYDNWTAGVGISTGKFVKPLPMPDGTIIEPNGKEFTIRVATLARWEHGRIVEEHLFWDNAHLFRQLGIGQ